MDSFVKKLKKLADESPLENFEWDIPNNCPISIPAECNSGFLKNIYLKENFHKTITEDQTLASHYWAIQDWGGIGSFKKNDKNNLRIKEFLGQLEKKSADQEHI